MSNSENNESQKEFSENPYLFHVSKNQSELIDYTGLSQKDIDQIAQLMNALAKVRETEQLLADASKKYMKLNEQDMRALHYLITAKRLNNVVTPSLLAKHLRISAASTTKLLNRLERDGHVVRTIHSKDRRAFAIDITPETHASARQTVGQLQARRVNAAARLTHRERSVVTRFLNDMADEISVANVDWANEHLAEPAE